MFFLFPKTDFWLNGKYRVISNQYEKEYTITFRDSIYTKVMLNGKEVRGEVQYGENLIYLRDYKKSLMMSNGRLLYEQSDTLKDDELISFKNKRSDSIDFCLHTNLKGGPTNWLHICRGSGKLIKIE